MERPICRQPKQLQRAVCTLLCGAFPQKKKALNSHGSSDATCNTCFAGRHERLTTGRRQEGACLALQRILVNTTCHRKLAAPSSTSRRCYLCLRCLLSLSAPQFLANQHPMSRHRHRDKSVKCLRRCGRLLLTTFPSRGQCRRMVGSLFTEQNRQGNGTRKHRCRAARLT